ncbi:hypothetical protein HDU84_000112 [Entophlyctis sp. JEL0112]|nr:hypothetical protein HDU84_000112 [Entophlyctis sp. JEL0112]
MGTTQTQLEKAMNQKDQYMRAIAAHRCAPRMPASDAAATPRISVHFRTRPVNQSESARGLFKVLYCNDDAGTSLYYPAFGVLTDNSIDVQEFKFDSNYDEHADSAYIYSRDVQPRLQDALANNGSLTVIAYGQTGSGKTYTMSSIAMQLVDDLPLDRDESVTSTVTIVEIQGDVIRDLSRDFETPHASKQRTLPSPKVLLDTNGTPVLKDVRSVPATSKNDVLKIFEHGFASRTTRATHKNLQSSRSHFLCTIRVTTDSGETMVRIVDLAGSEAGNDKTEHDPATIKESIAINKSLSAFKECIRKLNVAVTSGDSSADVHIPFRNSKLTMVLKDALDPTVVRHTHTAVFALAAPTVADIAHTFNTYRYALALKSLASNSNGAETKTQADSTILQHGNLDGVADKPVPLAKPASTPMAWSRAKLERWIEIQFENEVALPMVLGPSGDPVHFGRSQTTFVLPAWKFIYSMTADEWIKNVATYGGYKDADRVRKVREKYKSLFLKERVVADGGLVGGTSTARVGNSTVLMLETEETGATTVEKKKTRAELAMEKAKAKGAALRAER